MFILQFKEANSLKISRRVNCVPQRFKSICVTKLQYYKRHTWSTCPRLAAIENQVNRVLLGVYLFYKHWWLFTVYGISDAIRDGFVQLGLL